MVKREVGAKMLAVALLTVLSIITAVPFVWMIVTAFKTEMETMRIPLQFFPETLMWENFVVIFRQFNFWTYYQNSIKVAIGITVPQILVSSLAAYAFARLEFPGKNIIFVSLMMALMVPMQLILVPRFVLMIQFGWIDKLIAVIAPGVPSIFATFFIRQHIMTIPRELDEAAYIEGCSHPGIFWHIILPLCKPTLAAMATLALVFSWNTLLWPLTVLSSMSNFTLPIGIANFRGQFSVTFNLLMTGATVSVLPILVIFLIGQRYFIEGISTSGLKA
jgi:multiple sugar transport system permease protein